MIRGLKGELPAIGLMCLILASQSAAEPVHVGVDDFSGKTHGAGFSVKKGGECYVVTPLHVIAEASYEAITVTDRGGNTSKAVPTKRFAGSDIALLRVEDTAALQCGAEWKEPAGAERAVDQADFILAIKQDSNGKRTRNRFFLESSTSSSIELAPYSDRDSIRRGDSGSTLYANKKVVGMLLGVDPDTGLGRAIPQGHLYGLLKSDLTTDGKPRVALVPVILGRQENAYATSALRSLLSKGGGVDLVDAAYDPRTAKPLVPDSAEFVVVTRIIDMAYERVDNKNYKREKDRESSGFKKFGDSLLGRNESERYFTKYVFDIETEIHDLRAKKVSRNLAQQPIQINKGRSNQTDKEATHAAVGKMMEQTLKSSEFAHWLGSGAQNQIKNPFKGLFRRKKKEKPET